MHIRVLALTASTVLVGCGEKTETDDTSATDAGSGEDGGADEDDGSGDEGSSGDGGSGDSEDSGGSGDDSASPEDADGDGFTSTADGGDDCDDTDPAVHPGAADAWYDGVDSDCAGDDDFDQDGDGDASDAHGGSDCDDADSARSRLAVEDCGDGVDDDCDGLIDCEDGDCVTATSCVEDCTNTVDDDGDGLADCEDPACVATATCPAVALTIHGGEYRLREERFAGFWSVYTSHHHTIADLSGTVWAYPSSGGPATGSAFTGVGATWIRTSAGVGPSVATWTGSIPGGCGVSPPEVLPWFLTRTSSGGFSGTMLWFSPWFSGGAGIASDIADRWFRDRAWVGSTSDLTSTTIRRRRSGSTYNVTFQVGDQTSTYALQGETHTFFDRR